MSELKEYIVTLHRHEDLDAFYQDMETEGGDLYIPNRVVECHIRRPVSRNTHYMLSDQEAAQIKQDPRVWDVELTPEQLGIEMGPAWTQTSSLWSKANTLSQGELNWGLLRCTDGQPRENWYSNSISTLGIASGTVTVPFSGKNVDVVIQDGRLEVSHPEFAVNIDGTGGSRVVQYNWYSLNPTVTGGAADTYSYTPQDTGDDWHGSFCAGIAVGNTHGWARDANIYNISPGFVTGGVNSLYLFDYIKVWHQNKAINPATGQKNPTIINASWGFFSTIPISDILSVTYRGTVYTGPFDASQLTSYGFYVSGTNVIWSQRPISVDSDVADCIAAGIIVVGAAMNNYMKMDVVGGVDYNNTVTYNLNSVTYSSTSPHRGTTPGSSDNVICVGGVSALYNAAGEQKRVSSNCGPRIDVFAPGENIRSSSNVYSPGGTVTDARNSSFYVGKSNGTSFAAPQVTGLLATMLELNPAMTPSAAMSYITGNAKTGQMYSSNNLDYRDLQGAPNRYLFAQYPTTMAITPSTATATPSQTVTYTITMTGAPNGSLVYLTDSGTSLSTDFIDGLRQYKLTVNGGSASFTRTVSSGITGSRTSILQLRTGGYNGNIQATATTVTVDSNGGVPASACGPYSNQTVTGSLSGTVWGSNPYTDDSNFSAAVVHAGLATVGQTVTIQKTSPDFYSSFTGSTANGVTTLSYSAFCGHLISLASAPSITYNSFAGVTDLSAGSTTLIEGQFTATFTLATTGATTGTIVYWTTLGSVTYPLITSADFTDNTLQGTATIGSNGIATITRTARADLFTEGPEVFALEIRETGYTSPVKITSNSMGIADTSETPTTPPLSYTSFVGVTNDSSLNWYIGEVSGGTVTFTLNTTGGTPGTVVYWTTLAYFGSITASDFTDNTLEGSVTIASNGITTITRTARADAFTESSEAFKLEIREGSVSGAVKIVSTSSSDTSAIWIGDSSTTPVAAPTYAVSAAASSVDEGSPITFTVTTTNVSEATQLYWSLSNTTDFATSSGTVTINGNTGSFSVTPRADATTEVTAETFTASISTTNGGSAVATSGSITINDTSQTPSTPTYTVAAAGGATSVNEGVALTFNVTTANVTNGTVLNWAVSNAGDFATSTGTVTITTTGTNGTGTFSVTPRADATTENTPETFIVSIYTGSIAGTPVATSGSITINDTSKTPTSGITYVSFIPNSGNDTVLSYEVPLTPDGSVGPAAVSFILTTTGAPDGTVIYWTTIGFLGSTPSAGDFTDNTLQGTATIIGNTVTIVRTARQDYTTEELYEYYKLEIRETGYISDVTIISQYVALYDLSQPPTDVTIIPVASSVDEGASLLCTVTTVGLFDNSVLYWSVSNSGDFAVSNGGFTIVSNTGSFSVTPRADTATEGVETFTISILSDSINGLFSPTVFKTSSPITINDTSLTRSYSITPSATSVNEGTKIDFTVNTTNVTTGTVLYWSVSNSGDFSTSAGQVTIQGNTATFSVTPVLDYVTETPAETFTASISLTSGGAAVFTTGAITINDIVGQPTYIITPVANTVTEGAALRFDISTTNVPANTVLYWTVTNPVAVAVPPTPVYIITPAASSVNEGSALTFNISGSDIPPGTHYWTIGTNSGDFGVTSGNFTITGNTGSFNVIPLADTATEGAETFIVTVRTGSITGTPVVTTNPAITINDTSQAPPVPTYLVSTTSTSVNEGVAITFTVTTTNVTNGTVLNWAVSNAGDFATSNGTVTINGNTGTFTVTPTADNTTELTAETFTASIYTGSIIGLPVATSGQIIINDSSQTPVAATYAVAAAGNATSVNEGSPISFIVTTTNVPSGSSLNWAVNNLSTSSTADFTATNGSVIINDNTGTFTVIPVADATTETVIETFTVTIYVGSITGTPVATGVEYTINDTSQTPPPPTYAVAPAANSVNEGSPLTFNVTTTNVTNGTTLYWVVLTNAEDFATSSGTVTINGNTGSFSVTPRADATTELTAETFTVGIRTSALSVFNEATSDAVTILDASQTPPPGPTYSVAPAASSVDEGSPLTFNITTTNVSNGTTLYWAYKTGSADVTDVAATSGSFTINNLGQGTFTVTPIADTTTEGPQTFSVGVRTGSVTGPEEAVSISVIINDTSLTPVPPESATYAVAPASNFVDEGSSITFTVTTTNILANTILYWSVNNTGEFGISSGTVTIGNAGTGTFSVTPIADALTEGPETFRATIRSISSSGDTEAISGLVTINDTSQAPPSPNPPTYSVTPGASTVNEGLPLAFTVTTTNVAENTILAWSITNAGDFGISTGFVTINGNAGTFSVTPALDLTTEGIETFTASIYTGSTTGDPVATSSAVSIIDTSQGPPVSAISEYFIVPAALAVNEGTPLIITVNTLNVDDNTRLYWSINNLTTSNADFAISSGSVLITSNTGSFSVTPTQDNLVEPAETFTITIRTDSPTGSPVATSNPITINPTVSQSQLFAQKITPTVYNNARTQVAGVLGVTTIGQVGATQGYGQALASSAVSQHEKITEAHLDNLRLDIVKTRIHQSDADPNLVNVALSNIALADVFDSYSVLASTCNTLKDQIGPTQLATTSYTQTATYSAYTGTPNTGGGWKNYASYELTVTFATADAARYFFNAGSSFKFAASRTGGTIAPTVGLNQNTSWTNLLLDVTADNPAFVKNNFYALGTVYSTVYNKNSTGIYSANYYRIRAKSNVADNSYGGATVVTFKIEFVDAFNDGNSSKYDGVDGIFESVVVRNMPKGMGLEGAISVAAPTSVLPTPSNAFTVDGTPIYITATYQVSASPASVSEAGATINFTFTATNYNVPNTVIWFITATTQTGLSDFVETGWTSATNIDGYKQLIKTTTLAPTSTFAASFTTASIVTNPDSLTEGTETFTVTAVPTADGSGGGTPSDPVTITVTDSSKTATPGYVLSVPTANPQLSCIPGEGLGNSGLWVIASISLTGAAPLVIYGIYLDISANSNINAYSMTLWDGTVLTETTTTFYTLPTPKSVANGGNVQFTIKVSSVNGTAGTGSVTLRFRTNAGSVDGSGPNIVGPSYNSAAQSVSVRVVAPAPALSITANPPSVSYNYINGSTGSATTEITVTNTGNARATLSNYNVSNPGGGSVNAGAISGLILAGGTKTTTVTYSTSSAYNGTSNISITGLNNLTGTVSANRNVAVNAVQAFGIISQSIGGALSTQIYSAPTLNINISNSGNAPLTVTDILTSVNGGFTLTEQSGSWGFPATIAAGASRQFNVNWYRTRIGSSSFLAAITSNTGGNAGTITSTSATLTGTAITPSLSVTSTNGAVTNSYSFSTRAVIKKESQIAFTVSGEPNGYMWIVPQWEDGTIHQYLRDQSVFGLSQAGPNSANPAIGRQTISPFGGTGGFGSLPNETQFWYTGVGKLWMIIQNGKFDNGTQSYYLTPGTTGGIYIYVEVEIIPNMKMQLYLDSDTITNLDPGNYTITLPKYWWSMEGGPSNAIMDAKFPGWYDTNYLDYVYPNPEFATQLDYLGRAVMGAGATWDFNIRTIGRQFRATYKGTEYVSNAIVISVRSMAFFPQPGGLAWVSPDPSYAPDINVWYRYLRRLSPLVVGRVYRLDTVVDDNMWSTVTTDQDGTLLPSFPTNFGTGGTGTFTATRQYAILTFVVRNTGGPGTFILTVTDTVTNAIVYSTSQGGSVAWT